MKRRLPASFVMILTLAALAPPSIAHAGGLDTWYWRSPRPTGNDLNGVAFGGGLYAAVGDNGTILTSRHGATWIPRRPNIAAPQRPSLRAVAWGNGRFVAVGDSCAIRVSADGVKWRKKNPGFRGDLYGVSWCLDRFLAVGFSRSRLGWWSIILSSPDGEVWQKEEVQMRYPLYGVAYGNGVFVAAGLGAIMSSPDGKAWHKVGTPIYPQAFGLDFGAGTFVAVGVSGSILTSVDGEAWEDHSVSADDVGSLTGVVFGDGMFIAVGQCKSQLSSRDGTTWGWNGGGGFHDYHAVTWGAKGFVSVGGSGWVFTSPDGMAWVARSSRVTSLGRTVWGGGKFLSIHDGIVSQSVDGVTWEQESHSELSEISSLTYGNGLFVAAGSRGYYYDGEIYTSPDGHVWTRAASFSYPISEVKALGGIFLANGFIYRGVPVNREDSALTGKVLLSLDGRFWQEVYSRDGEFYQGLAYGGGTFVVATYGAVLTTWDGAHWFRWELPQGEQFHDIAYGNGVFVGLGGSAAYLSRDGRNWAPIDNQALANGYAITFAHGWFVVHLGTTLHVSRDGTDWRAITLQDNASVGAVIPGPRSFLALGGTGTIIESGNFDQEAGLP